MISITRGSQCYDRHSILFPAPLLVYLAKTKHLNVTNLPDISLSLWPLFNLIVVLHSSISPTDLPTRQIPFPSSSRNTACSPTH